MNGFARFARVGRRLALLTAAVGGALFACRAWAVELTSDDLMSPMIRSWVPPVYPPEAAAQQLRGEVTVRIVVDESGAVTQARALSSSDPIFEDAAIASVRQWHFEPAVDAGRKVSSCLDVPLWFSPSDLKRKQASLLPPQPTVLAIRYAPRTKAQATTEIEPEYPEALLPTQLPGEVQVRFNVTTEGDPRDIQVLAASHVEFVRPTVEAITRAKFHPARVGDLVVAAPIESSFEFSAISTEHVDVLAAWGIALEAREESEALNARPRPVAIIEPVYPYDLALAGTEGSATVDFEITARGQVKSIAIRDATHPNFGDALAAAVARWQFIPARSGPAVAIRASAQRNFALATETPGAKAISRLTSLIRSDAPEAFNPRSLESPLAPIYRLAPRYPDILQAERPRGDAEVEFIIDRDGRCRLARATRASHAAFGWAAVTAVEQWVFTPPMRAGQPVAVRVKVPFTFVPPPVE